MSSPSVVAARRVRRTSGIGGRPPVTIHRLTDPLHDGRTVHVCADGLVATLTTWLAELGAASPLVDDLAEAVRAGDWPTAHALSDFLSVEVSLAV
jgi:hypothetical protein